MTRWLVTGATGLLGANAVRRLSQHADVVGTSRKRPPAMEPARFVDADIADRGSRARLVERSRADVVLHAAAVSSIEACEAAPELAWAINVEASADLAAQAAAAGAGFVFVSTDAVFDGERGGYRETDQTSPTTEYGRTKVAAEQAVLAAHPGAVVARVNFYGWSPSGSRSLAEFFYRHVSEGRDVKGFTDITVSTLYVDDLVDGLAALVRVGASGVVHVASPEPITKFDFGRLLASTLGFDAELVHPALSTDVLAHARGSNLALDTTRFATLCGAPLAGQAAAMMGLKRALDQGVPLSIASFASH